MSKSNLFYGVLLAGTVFTILGASANAQMMAAPTDNSMYQNDTMPMSAPTPPGSTYYNGQVPPPPMAPHSLGTLDSADMNGAPSRGMPSMPPQGDMGGMAMPQRPLPPMPPQQADAYTSLQPMQSGEIRYVTGGIGDDERNAMKAMEKDYDLRVMSASRSGAFVGDTKINIMSSNGGPVLTTVAGPLFYADLPNGKYVVEAGNEGQTKRQNVVIAHGKPVYVHLSW
jgi:hypothetical protein